MWWCLLWTMAGAAEPANGDASAPLGVGWSDASISAGRVTRASDAALPIPFPSAPFAFLLRSGGPGQPAILRSEPFVVTHAAFRLAEASQGPGGLVARLAGAGAPRDLPLSTHAGSFGTQQLDLRALCGERITMSIARTGDVTSGSLIDDLGVAGAVCPDFRDLDGDGRCPRGVDHNRDGTCTDASEIRARLMDCDDRDPRVFVGASEVAGNDIDEDCDGGLACFRDEDGDDFGRSVRLLFVGTCDSRGYARWGADCNDRNPNIFPGAPEVVGNSIDEDCDDELDCYEDVDQDGFGHDPTIEVEYPGSCDAPHRRASSNNQDCDDDNPDINPNAAEIVGNDIDEDCDEILECYPDFDSDGYGGDEGTVGVQLAQFSTCDEDPQASSRGGDCLDTVPEVNPGHPEVPWDHWDNDCDNSHDCYVDNDMDQHGTEAIQTHADDDGCWSNDARSTLDDDCDDDDAQSNPGAVEVVGNSIDEDCNELITCWLDSDRDGYGNDGGATVQTNESDCSNPINSATADDCDDEDPAINPAAYDEPGNGIDEDCDGEDAPHDTWWDTADTSDTADTWHDTYPTDTWDYCTFDPAACDPCVIDPSSCWQDTPDTSETADTHWLDPCTEDPSLCSTIDTWDPCLADPSQCDPCLIDPASCEPTDTPQDTDQPGGGGIDTTTPDTGL